MSVPSSSSEVKAVGFVGLVGASSGFTLANSSLTITIQLGSDYVAAGGLVGLLNGGTFILGNMTVMKTTITSSAAQTTIQVAGLIG